MLGVEGAERLPQVPRVYVKAGRRPFRVLQDVADSHAVAGPSLSATVTSSASRPSRKSARLIESLRRRRPKREFAVATEPLAQRRRENPARWNSWPGGWRVKKNRWS